MRLAARLTIWRPTVKPICATSPTACTAVVTTPGEFAGGVVARGGSGRGAELAAALGGAAVVVAAFGLRAAPLGLAAAAFGFAPFAAAFVPAAARVRPSRFGRVAGRLPSTLCWASVVEAFLAFFFADLSLIASGW
jgi:hypothetical protein